jgi:hypothetical protein
MIFDALELFDPAGTAITVTAVSTNVLDVGITGAQQPTGNQQRDIGPAYVGFDSLDVFVLIVAAFTAAGAATMQVSIQAAVDNAGVPGTYYDQVMTGAIPVANLIAGRDVLRTPVPRWAVAISNVNTRPRFYRLNYTIATGPMTAGTMFSGLVSSSGRQDAHSYPSGIPITA